jgi:hypothetical protein
MVEAMHQTTKKTDALKSYKKDSGSLPLGSLGLGTGLGLGLGLGLGRGLLPEIIIDKISFRSLRSGQSVMLELGLILGSGFGIAIVKIEPKYTISNNSSYTKGKKRSYLVWV